MPTLPLLRYNEKHVLLISSKYSLFGMSKQFFDEGRFKYPTFFIDSNLRRYEIFDVIKARLSLNFIDITGWIEGKFRYRVEYDLSEPVQLSFQEASGTIVDLIVRKRWYAQGGETKAQFLKAFDSFTNTGQLFANISAYGDPPF